LDKTAKVRGVKKRYILVPLGIAAMLAFGLFTGGPLVPIDDYGDVGAGVVKEDKVDTLASTFGGEPVSIKGGISVQATELKSFVPSDLGALEEGALPQLFTISITNSTKKSIDLFSVAIVKTDIDGETQAICSDIFDESQNLMGVPFEPLAAGDTVEFPWGMACPGTAGAKISVTIAITDKEQVQFDGKLA
jgi:hypothetical protein